MTTWQTTVHDLTVVRGTNDVPSCDETGPGVIERVDVEVTREKKCDDDTYHQTVSYVVDEGIAYVEKIGATYPELSSCGHTFRPEHVAAILAEADELVPEAVPEVEGVQALSATLRLKREKYDRGRTDTDAEDRGATV